MSLFFVESGAELSGEQIKMLGIECIQMPYTINEETIYPYVDGKYDSHEYYNILRSGVVPKTSALSPIEYINYFEPVFESGQDIFYVHFSSNLSCTFETMNKAIEILKEYL